MMKTVHVRVEGRVQGVFFRDFTQQEAKKLGLTGWVMNIPDGSVEAVFQGEEEQLAEMTQWLYTGSPHSRVTGVQIRELSESEPICSFNVRYR